MSKKVLIIGAGLGSLATALRLSSLGYSVEIVEKDQQAGGRLNQLVKDGFTFDLGPSFFSMSYEFNELFESCGTDNPLELTRLDPLYAVFFENRTTPLKIFSDLKALGIEFQGIENKMEEKAGKYLAAAGKLFHDTENIVIKRNFNGKLDYLSSLTKVPLKHTPKMGRSMWSELERNFDSEEVKVIFSLVSFFLGSTPFHTPAIYSLLNYTELVHDGYWSVKGGMYSIVTSLVSLLEKRGVKIHYNREITGVEIKNGEVSGFYDQHKKLWNADVYVVNSDAASFRGKVLERKKFSEKKLDAMEWTLAPFTIYLGVKGKIEQLEHHNYFLGNNFREYANKIFSTSVSPDKPYYYVNAASKSTPESAPDGCENLFILCPVPDLRHKPDWNDAGQLTATIIDDLSKRLKTDLSPRIISKTVMTPVDWQNRFNLYRGSGLGLAHGLNQVGGFRPKNKDEEFNNVYYTGASTVPGTGLPIVVISSRLVTERIQHDHAAI